MATNLFESFPRIAYTLDDGESEQVVVDIFKRIILSKEFQENSSFFESYEVLHGETPEELSYRFYGTQSLYWLILMTNNIVDPRFEWPVSEENLLKIVEDKYGGENNIFAINRAVNSKGYQVETFFVLSEESTHKNPIRVTIEADGINYPLAFNESPDLAGYESNYDVEQTNNEINRTIKVLKPEIVQDILTSYKKTLTT
jgi:LysM repeat protein